MHRKTLLINMPEAIDSIKTGMRKFPDLYNELGVEALSYNSTAADVRALISKFEDKIDLVSDEIADQLGKFVSSLKTICNAKAEEEKIAISDLENEDAYFIQYNQLPLAQKKNAEIGSLEKWQSKYSVEDTKEKINQKKQANQAFLMRLNLILDRVDYWSAKKMKQDYPCSYYYQKLRFLLNGIEPKEVVQSIFNRIENSIYNSENKFISEQAKLEQFEQVFLDEYYRVRKETQIWESNRLGDILETFIKDPRYLNLMAKYKFKVPHVVGKNDEAPQIVNASRREKRVALVNMEVMEVNGKSNKKLLQKLKTEYDEVVFFPQQRGNTSIVQTNMLLALEEADVKASINDTSNIDAYWEAPVAAHITYTVFEKDSTVNAELDVLLKHYINKREIEQNISNSSYNSFFSRLTGMSATVKINAAKKLVEAVNGTLEEEFTNDDIVALRSGRLGEILKQYEEARNKLPSSFTEAEKKRNLHLSMNRRGL